MVLHWPQDEGSHLVYVSPLPASALSMAATDVDAYGWGALAAAAAGSALAGLPIVAATDAQLRAPHVEVTTCTFGGWDQRGEPKLRKGRLNYCFPQRMIRVEAMCPASDPVDKTYQICSNAGDCVGVRNGAKRLVLEVRSTA